MALPVVRGGRGSAAARRAGRADARRAAAVGRDRDHDRAGRPVRRRHRRRAGERRASGGGAPAGAGCLAVLGYEGAPAAIAERRERLAAVLRGAGGEPLGEGPGDAWAHGRFNAPYLRDALLDVGAFAETLETAAFWSGVPALYAAVREALIGTLARAGTPPLVMCHISHVYPAGASLYFTVVSASGPSGREVGHWREAKRAASDAILGAGGTISHHHGVGTDHRDWYAREIGPLGGAVLRAVKERLDPSGVLNPGVLVPPADGAQE
ncbi:FAD-linked oxidase C-terminal domain-containing protein [Actinomadura yumaensis]|uniref:FAD-linked oxidase C-terminal domain-containing protein n=1 Tax=Actinomadura yumaensis TaxID=111807 RepID=UPI0036196538